MDTGELLLCEISNLRNELRMQTDRVDQLERVLLVAIAQLRTQLPRCRYWPTDE
jgi:hypothetical protein